MLCYGRHMCRLSKCSIMFHLLYMWKELASISYWPKVINHTMRGTRRPWVYCTAVRCLNLPPQTEQKRRRRCFGRTTLFCRGVITPIDSKSDVAFLLAYGLRGMKIPFARCGCTWMEFVPYLLSVTHINWCLMLLFDISTFPSPKEVFLHVMSNIKTTADYFVPYYFYFCTQQVCLIFVRIMHIIFVKKKVNVNAMNRMGLLE